MISTLQPLAILYRLGMSFGIGYLCSYLIALDLAYFYRRVYLKLNRFIWLPLLPSFLCLFCDWNLLYTKS